ncbi:putative C-type lectin domain family 20 member A [Pangasianodon hypophthalmus]|uniref:putative C-type lectin domain family 20 member A n=1 Tax=Pangasianodon hypophthalmus TaxID=310915 RepID=UPI00230811F8|nr:putative C-type lectin domain family 20 member A [Pangasianodon hypophthalmus]
MIRIQFVAQSANFRSSAWIGLYNDVNSWRWSMGNAPLGSLRMWSSPNPDNWHSEEYCAGTSPWGWNDASCTILFPFVCFDDTKAGTNKYIYYSSLQTWPDAQSYCRQHHTDLASVRNETENSIIYAMVYGETWFGLFRDSWKWSDKTNFTTITQIPGQLDNAMGNENCVSLTNGQAADEPCSYIKPFFCYSVITGQKQIIRVKVQSNQDVNDPAVKVVVLDKIRQKLNGYVTVKWREQPDGLVFNKIKEDTPLLLRCQ